MAQSAPTSAPFPSGNLGQNERSGLLAHTHEMRSLLPSSRQHPRPSGALKQHLHLPPSCLHHPFASRTFSLVLFALFTSALLAHPASGLLPHGTQIHVARSRGTQMHVARARNTNRTWSPRRDRTLRAVRAQRRTLRVLFIGNSWTYYNDLPALLQQLSVANRRATVLSTTMYAKPARTLKQHASDPEVLKLLNGRTKWNYVILQEQSQTLAFGIPYATDESIPFVRELVKKIRAIRATPLLFLTWGYLDGDPQMSYYDQNNKLIPDTFELMMQRQIDGYSAAARASSIRIVPAGIGFRRWYRINRRNRGKQAQLYNKDGKHPGLMGSYLVACAFFRYLQKGMTPIGNSYTAGLSTAVARDLQIIADYVVRKNNLPR